MKCIAPTLAGATSTVALSSEIETYIASIPEEYRPIYDKLHDIIMSAAPDAELIVHNKNLQYSNANGKMWIGRWKGGFR